eukprot:403353832
MSNPNQQKQIIQTFNSRIQSSGTLASQSAQQNQEIQQPTNLQSQNQVAQALLLQSLGDQVNQNISQIMQNEDFKNIEEVEISNSPNQRMIFYEPHSHTSQSFIQNFQRQQVIDERPQRLPNPYFNYKSLSTLISNFSSQGSNQMFDSNERTQFNIQSNRLRDLGIDNTYRYQKIDGEISQYQDNLLDLQNLGNFQQQQTSLQNSQQFSNSQQKQYQVSVHGNQNTVNIGDVFNLNLNNNEEIKEVSDNQGLNRTINTAENQSTEQQFANFIPSAPQTQMAPTNLNIRQQNPNFPSQNQSIVGQQQRCQECSLLNEILTKVNQYKKVPKRNFSDTIYLIMLSDTLSSCKSVLFDNISSDAKASNGYLVFNIPSIDLLPYQDKRSQMIVCILNKLSTTCEGVLGQSKSLKNFVRTNILQQFEGLLKTRHTDQNAIEQTFDFDPMRIFQTNRCQCQSFSEFNKFMKKILKDIGIELRVV